MVNKVVRNLRILPRWIIIIIDLMIISLSTVLAYLLRFNFELQELINFDFQHGVLAAVIAGGIAIAITRSYQGIIRYTSLQDGVRIIYTSLISMGLLFFTSWYYQLTNGKGLIPNSVIIITFLASLMFLFYYRLVVKNIFTFYKSAVTKSDKVAIFGAGQSGIVTKHVIDNDSGMKVTAFLEDDDHKIGKVIDGIRIYDANKNLQMLFRTQN
ncbi:MAG: polysaccharide biosynthesis protein, partial [Cyclobacteriaceae bacterium]|nr:polysaccharide biosynthesis protein [Cyclobacteriaceae bacterium]